MTSLLPARVACFLSCVLLFACPPPPPVVDAGPPPENACGAVPEGCVELLPQGSATPVDATHVASLPQPVASCFVVREGGRYVHEYVNVVEGGALYFEDGAATELDFRVKSMLVEKGGLVQAGSEGCPFGAQGRRLTIGLYGDDPTQLGAIAQPADPGIQCETGKDRGELRCLPETLEPSGTHFCTESDSSDPCNAHSPPALDDAGVRLHGTSGNNFRLEHYGNLAFDPNPFGYKVLAVAYGGTLRFFGDKGTRGAAAVEGAGSCRVPTAEQSTLDSAELRAWASLTGTSWTRLDGQQDEGEFTVLTLDRAVEDWREGDELVVGPTDWYPTHHEVRAIVEVLPLAAGKTRLKVKKLQWPHAAKLFDLADLEAQGAAFTGTPRRTAADLRAPVGLLTRSITVRSLGKTADEAFPATEQCLAGSADPACFFGGHVLFRQGFREVQVQGVEFKQLGQGGRMGHYPVHFHLAKATDYTKGRAFVRDSAIWDSMTRFVTLHGTQGVDVSRNVGFLSMGHGYYLEDATEVNNRLCHNLGVGARASMVEFFEGQKALFARAKQQDPAATAPPQARVVPPILDGVKGSTARGGPKDFSMGSDGLMPVTFWTMNNWNELVGNLASGVYGFGSCYWLMNTAISGASQDHQFDGLAALHANGARTAPLRRFRGNGCSTAAHALPASRELPPATGQDVGFTPMKNPYLFKADGSPKSDLELQRDGHYLYERPIVLGNFEPLQLGSPAGLCAAGASVGGPGPDGALEGNVSACPMTLVDRFTTSYNWTEVNFGSIWFRPQFYLFANGAVTDQLFGGLTFVTAGSWLQVPPAYFSLAQNSLFVGSTQYEGSPLGHSAWADRSGPLLRVGPTTDLATYAPCAGPKGVCAYPEEGTGYWRGSVQPKRLLNIYDGPSHSDGNTFLNVGAWECDPMPCAGLTAEACRASGKLPVIPDGSGDMRLPCGVYGSTTQPSPLPPSTRPQSPPVASDPINHRMVVLDAAIGWKQPNGFYYPPAFGHAGDVFLAKAPTLPGSAGGLNGLNQCLEQGATPRLVPGDCRHNAIDRTQIYLSGNLISPNAIEAFVSLPRGNTDDGKRLRTTPVDFQTILIDTDGSLTGATGTLGAQAGMPTTSVSRNPFFDAPGQDDECLSFGVQTSPYTFATSVVAKLAGSPKQGQTSVDRPAGTPWARDPMVPIYRQWLLEKDKADLRPDGGSWCGSICDDERPTDYGCPRGSFMMGAAVGHSPHLTMSLPRDLSQAGALYYVDTNAQQQRVDCLANKTGDSAPATFDANGRYVVYNLFARHDSLLRYAFYVGDAGTSLADLEGVFVRVDPHRHLFGREDKDSLVTLECDPAADGGWCAGTTFASVTNGVLTVTLDHAQVADDFLTKNRPDHERCLPRDLCFFKDDHCEPCAKDPSKCPNSALPPEDLAQLSRPDSSGKAPLDTICEWATRSSGTVANGATERVFADCPAEGCLGFAFKLPGDFQPKPYAQVNAPTMALAPSACFSSAAFAGHQLASSMSGGVLKDPLCGPARQPEPADFCAMP